MIELKSVNEGCLVSLDLMPGTAPHGCYIGRAKTAGKHGIRINPAQWDELNGITLSEEDIYVPWTKINSMLVCTD